MVERRRKPLVLSSTKALLNSLLTTSRNQVTDRDDDTLSSQNLLPAVQLKTGVLQAELDGISVSQTKNSSGIGSIDSSALVGLSISVLKRLSITSGSLVLIKNVDCNVQRIGQVLVLDAPYLDCNTPNNEVPFSNNAPRMLLFPSYSYPKKCTIQLDPEIAYLSPLLVFNLNLHVSCLKSIVCQGKETLSSLFEAQLDDKTSGKENAGSAVHLELEPLTQLPKYASHLRAAFVRIPECSTLECLKRSPSVEAEDRQELIDMELNNFFTVDRFLAEGDIFSISIHWDCKSPLCAPCNQKMQGGSNDVIYFKVVGMEPSEEHVLRVNRTQTALVLGGTISSAVPPEILIPSPKVFIPIQQDTVKTLASILAPPLCPSALSSKYRVAILLHGLRGCGKRTVVKYVARQLGLHVVEYSCHNLLASSERKTSSALAQAFTTAHRYAPTILLLRHFDVFRDLASQEDSPLEQHGVSSEVASVIKEFTEPLIENDDVYYSEQKSNYEVCRHPLLLVAAADSSEGLTPNIRRCFSHEISMGPLTEEQRKQMLSQALRPLAELLPNIIACCRLRQRIS